MLRDGFRNEVWSLKTIAEPNAEILSRLSNQEDRILITKDSDFRDTCILHSTPRKLIKVNLGNIPHQVLSDLLFQNLGELARLNERPRFLVEVDIARVSVIELG